MFIKDETQVASRVGGIERGVLDFGELFAVKVAGTVVHLVFNKCSGALSSTPAGACLANNIR